MVENLIFDQIQTINTLQLSPFKNEYTFDLDAEDQISKRAIFIPTLLADTSPVKFLYTSKAWMNSAVCDFLNTIDNTL